MWGVSLKALSLCVHFSHVLGCAVVVLVAGNSWLRLFEVVDSVVVAAAVATAAVGYKSGAMQHRSGVKLPVTAHLRPPAGVVAWTPHKWKTRRKCC